MSRPVRSVALFGAILLVVGLIAGCSDDESNDPIGSEGSTAPTVSVTTTSGEVPENLRIMVTNDDGYASEGIDAVVEALRSRPGTEVTVVAPATNQSGAGGKTTPGALTATDVTTRSGYAAKAVAGTPADTVTWAITQGNLGFRPDLVVSGINQGQNIGAFVDVSGTVGAARAAATAGLPALAASQGGPGFDYASGVTAVLRWLDEHASSLQAGAAWNINIPSCAAGTEIAGTVTVPVASARNGPEVLGAQTCPAPGAAPAVAPADDVTAFLSGYVSLSQVA